MAKWSRIGKGFWLFLGGALVLSGCVTSEVHRLIPHKVDKEGLAHPSPALPSQEEGSLWSPSHSANLYSDVKARNVGDIVTISIVESARASKNAETKTARDSGLNASWTGIFELITKGWKFHKTPIGTSHQIDFSNQFDGKGETTRSSSMNAYITARVVQVFPNGNLLIRGTRLIQINNENQYISIEGIVRPEDISSTNVVLSTYIAEAKIELTGYGAISDKQRPGWLVHLLDWLWPF
ncbi:MAG: flagellar basal body L-ring protein FlgH [Desulfobacterota bacterium]|nr:flagellar basal body L-ring protein FlgH [Thermodesulfobacteriota bacterium]